MLPNRSTSGAGAVGTEEPEQHSTIAGRALRALRTTRAPAEQEPPAAAPAEPEPSSPPVEETPPEVADTPPVAAAPQVSLVKPARATRADVAGRPRRNGLLIAALIALVAAVAYGVIGLIVYLNGTDSTTAKSAQARDDALVAARIDIATLNTLDYRNVKAGLQKWLAVSTGAFHDQLAQQAKSVESAIAKAKVATTGRVIAAAVTDLNAAGNSAIVIASLDTVKTPAGGQSALDRNRYRATMQLVDGVWKVADLSIVAVGLS
jgi:Mce-associated membrane protein